MPRLLIHTCCAPCLSATLEEIEENLFPLEDLVIYYYNPNIFPKEEFDRRAEEVKGYLKRRYGDSAPDVLVPPYDNDDWHDLVAPYRDTGERGFRCWLCYHKRLRAAFRYAKENGFDYVATTLMISRHKVFEWLEEIGDKLSRYYKIEFISKRWNERRSIEISKEYGLYRQNYCGCVFSLAERIIWEKQRNRR